MSFLADHNYRVYRAYQLPRFSEAHQARVASLVANYIYIKYTSTTTDLIPRFRTAEDVHVKVHADAFAQGPLEISYMTIVHQAQTQLVVFVRKAAQHIALVKSPSPVFLVQTLEALDCDVPLALQEASFSPAKMVHLFNLFRPSSSSPGEVHLVFTPPAPLVADSLREIAVTLPEKDAVAILGSADLPMDGVYAWLEKTTTVKFANLRVKSIRCAYLGLEGGKVRFSGDVETALSNLVDVWTES